MNAPAIPAAAELILPAPAKLNLMLHILGRRADGYHELQTLFQFLDFGDELGFALRPDGEIHLHTPIDGVPHDSNLIVRAARQLQQQAGCTLGADIWLDKRLPMGGGLGGGSSDAATTLLGLNHLWQLGWDEDRLAALGLSIGDSIDVGMKTLRLARVLTYEPDRAGNFYSLTPRVLMNLADLDATGVVQPGSRVTYRDLWRGEPEANAQRARRTRNGKTKRGERKRNQNTSNANTRTNLTKTADQNEPNLAWKRTSEQISAG